MDSNIRTLVEKAKQGDNSAFSTLYQMYYPQDERDMYKHPQRGQGCR